MPAGIPSVVLIPIVVFDVFGQLVVCSKEKVVSVITGSDNSVWDDDMNIFGSLVALGEKDIYPFPIGHIIIIVCLT